MKHVLLPSLAAAALVLAHARAAAPVVSNIRAAQIAGTKQVEVLYDVSDADGDALTIGLEISGDGGLTYSIPATALSGQAGPRIAPGSNRRLVWNAGLDWNNQYVPNARARVTAYDGTTPVPPVGMVYIPAGSFQMGDNFYEGGQDEQPLHNVSVGAVFMERFEVSKEIWIAVKTWGEGHGYSFDSGGSYSGNGHPVHHVNWYEAVKRCNASSEKEGLTPIYYTDSSQVAVYRTGDLNLNNSSAKWSANGYRLPTEAEWEKGARGGVQGFRFPWGNSINGSTANFYGSGDAYEVGTTPCGYYNGLQLPAGANMANGYGLYDVAGNVLEWCWDSYGNSYYSDANANNNPHGPLFEINRVVRGGSNDDASSSLRIARRIGITPASSGFDGIPGTGQDGGCGIRRVRNVN